MVASQGPAPHAEPWRQAKHQHETLNQCGGARRSNAFVTSAASQAQARHAWLAGHPEHKNNKPTYHGKETTPAEQKQDNKGQAATTASKIGGLGEHREPSAGNTPTASIAKRARKQRQATRQSTSTTGTTTMASPPRAHHASTHRRATQERRKPYHHGWPKASTPHATTTAGQPMAQHAEPQRHARHKHTMHDQKANEESTNTKHARTRTSTPRAPGSADRASARRACPVRGAKHRQRQNTKHGKQEYQEVAHRTHSRGRPVRLSQDKGVAYHTR